MRDKLIGALIGLARATEGNEELIAENTDKILLEGLIATMPNSSYSDEMFQDVYERVMTEKRRIIPSCFECAYPCGRNNNYDMQELWDSDEDIRALKFLILSGTQTLATYINTLEHADEEATRFLYKALIMLGIYWDVDGLIPILTELGNVTLKYTTM